MSKNKKDVQKMIEKTLMDAFLSGEKLDYDNLPTDVPAKEPVSKKIPGVQKEDGSACCGGGCCTPKKPERDENYQPVLNKKQYLAIINQILDPETFVGIVDMGLIYDVEEYADGKVEVTMTLTSMGCPAGPQITTEVDAVLKLQKHVQDVNIEIVWEPGWHPDMMNPEVRAMLFGDRDVITPIQNEKFTG